MLEKREKSRVVWCQAEEAVDRKRGGVDVDGGWRRVEVQRRYRTGSHPGDRRAKLV